MKALLTLNADCVYSVTSIFATPHYLRNYLSNVGSSVIACWKPLLNAELWSNFEVIWLTHVRIARILRIKTRIP